MVDEACKSSEILQDAAIQRFTDLMVARHGTEKDVVQRQTFMKIKY